MEKQKELMSRDEKWSLKGKTALVTGGTRGIGYAIVEELAGFGARIHTCSRNEEELNERVREWKAKGYQVTGSVCDLSSGPQRLELMHTVASHFDGKLNILVSLSCKKLESPYNLCQIAHPFLKASGRGTIVFISSVAGELGLPGLAIYSASKGAINQLTRNLACEWAEDNIRVNSVAPWAVKTTIVKPDNLEESLRNKFGALLARTPLKPIAEPDEISPLTAFLCLPAASYITGQVIYVDGGFTSSG